MPLALLDDDVSDCEKQKIANSIQALKMPCDNIFYYKAEGKVIVVIEEVLQFDLPSIAPLINNFSFYIFSLVWFEEDRLKGLLVLPPEL